MVTMQRVAVLILVACCALTALSSAEDTNKPKSPVTMSSAEAFKFESTNQSPSTIPLTTDMATPKPTTPKPTTPKSTTPKSTTPKTTTPKPTTPKSTTPKTTTPKPTTPKSTTPKTTTPKPTTPKPTTPKTTTPKPTTPKTTTPKTTTPKPTTPKPTTHSTTPKPTTTAAPKPTPPTNLTVGNYSVKTSKGEVCLKAQMALQIRLQTEKANGTFIVQPAKTKSSGGCSESEAKLTLTFEEGSITFNFNKSVAKNTVYVNAVSFSLTYPLATTGNQKYSANNQSLHLFAAKIGHSHSCREESVYMGNGLYLDANKDRMQAFNITKDGFGYPDPCPADQPDYRVAIAVGVTLLVLIIIVLIVYLLGRRRRTAGYQSL